MKFSEKGHEGRTLRKKFERKREKNEKEKREKFDNSTSPRAGSTE